MTRLREQYEKVVRPALMSEFSYKNPMQVPRLEKIVINMGVGKGHPGQQEADDRGERACPHRRPEAGGDQGAQVELPPSSCARA